jgi:hypothetical protein
MSKSKRRLSEEDNTQVKVEFSIALYEESPSTLLETRLQLLAAGGESITKKFVGKLDEALKEDGKDEVNMETDDVSFTEPVYKELEDTSATSSNENNSEQEKQEIKNEGSDEDDEDEEAVAKEAASSEDSGENLAFEIALLGQSFGMSYQQLVLFLGVSLIMTICGFCCMLIRGKSSRKNSKVQQDGTPKSKIDQYISDNCSESDDLQVYIEAIKAKKKSEKKMKSHSKFTSAAGEVTEKPLSTAAAPAGGVVMGTVVVTSEKPQVSKESGSDDQFESDIENQLESDCESVDVSYEQPSSPISGEKKKKSMEMVSPIAAAKVPSPPSIGAVKKNKRASELPPEIDTSNTKKMRSSRLDKKRSSSEEDYEEA